MVDCRVHDDKAKYRVANRVGNDVFTVLEDLYCFQEYLYYYYVIFNVFILPELLYAIQEVSLAHLGKNVVLWAS
ncbi:hypothetical protein ACMD2_15884 [Ananas comosus]|uniref:Uncharacterized protein n=1 Tax=Ananas comosus TaxID=4615 RepID=A0A199V5Q2_ANACO|nr:hypothetical protein ACMD2_15884 [Ananas comosus]